MEDLINEEDFLPKKSCYNPWRIFKAFYAITFSELILLVIISAQISDDYVFLVALLFIFLPVVTAKTMFFYKKENALLSYKIIALGVVLQLFIFYIPIIAVTVISEPTVALKITGVLFFDIVLCITIFFLVSSKHKKISKYENSKLYL